MTSQLATLERRITALETSTRRWRALAVTLGATGLVAIAAAFQQTPVPQSVEAERITLRSARNQRGLPGTRVELSVAFGGVLQVQFISDSAQWTGISTPALQLLDASGREIARLGSPVPRPLAK
jgi:hypothetical protein